MMDQHRLPWFAELNRGLTDRLDEATLEQRIRDNAAMLHALAAEMLVRVQAINATALDDLPMLANLGKNATSNLLREAA
jgi:hypothetical protein